MQKLYHGTIESIAKTAPWAGLKPYASQHTSEKAFSSETADTITLTTFYGAYQAFTAQDAKKPGRWAIIEVLPISLEPCPHFLEHHKGKLTWQKSMDMVGFCLHKGKIPPKNIGKIWIFEPKSNWMIARSVIHTAVGPESYAADRKKLEVVNRWLTGSFVSIDDWLADQKEQFTKEQKDKMGEVWNNRTGLDLFHHG